MAISDLSAKAKKLMLSVAFRNRRVANEVNAKLDEIKDVIDQFNLLLAKLDADFTAQNLAVTSSQLDEDYESTLEV